MRSVIRARLTRSAALGVLALLAACSGGGGGGGVAPAPAPVPVPTPTPVPVPTPTPTPTPSGSWPSTGDQLIAWTQSHYPEYLKPSSNRVANMIFLRDRMIEAGICGGMRLGWNLKRGGPEVSVDYITWNGGGGWVGVDIAHDYDNQSITLQLTWAPQPDDPYATYTPYTGALPCSK